MSMANIDTFGNAMFGTGPAFRGRLIQTGPTTFGLFPEHAEQAIRWVNTTEEPKRKGRTLMATTTDGEAFAFQRASCGCQTPMHLRGPKRTFLSQLQTADA